MEYILNIRSPKKLKIMHGVGQETTKRNSALRHGPSLFKNMNRYYGLELGGNSINSLSWEEKTALKHQMKLAKRKGVIREVKYYIISIVIAFGLFYFFYRILM